MKHPLLCHGVGEYGCQGRRRGGELATRRTEDGEYLCCGACLGQMPPASREYVRRIDASFVRELLRATLKERHVTRRAAREESRDLIGWLRDDAARRAA